MNTSPLIHVVDDDEPLRTALLRLLDMAGFEARGYASAGEFLLHPPPDRPSCLLLDVRMPGPSGLDLQGALEENGIPLPIVFLTGHADVPSTVQALKGGAVDFLEKPIQREPLLAALGRALARDAAQRAARKDAESLRVLFATLSTRERDVFDRIVAGKLNKQIADELGSSERTIKTQRAHLMVKLGVDSAAELGALAERLSRSAPGAEQSPP
ncbi:response regulator [Variovorax sp. J22R24]|uniref:response regulator transcription factor n=1 Tax=Variovorax gracilis TaxID=3053502 RepID=UPI002577C9DF|nr:response regulator [Variovorax sp. J22R24]MDM0108007.1 response regulator [Variovorax sp. J22R24]